MRLQSGHWLVLGLVLAGVVGLTAIRILDHRTLPAREGYWRVHADLRAIAEAGQTYLREHGGEQVSVRLLYPDYFPAPVGRPIETYLDLEVRQQGRLRVRLENEVEVFVDYP